MLCRSPLPRAVTTCPANGIKYTLWSKWQIDGDLTLGEFIKAVKDKYKVHAGEAFRDSREGVQPPLVAGQNMIRVDAACVDEEGNDVDTTSFLLKIK